MRIMLPESLLIFSIFLGLGLCVVLIRDIFRKVKMLERQEEGGRMNLQGLIILCESSLPFAPTSEKPELCKLMGECELSDELIENYCCLNYEKCPVYKIKTKQPKGRSK